MKKKRISVEQLLAAYWLNSETHNTVSESHLGNLKHFAEQQCFAVSNADLRSAASHLDGRSPDRWVVFVCFLGHPHFLWNFMIDAVAMAEDDEQLAKIATELAEHILAHCGSMIPYFEQQGNRDAKFRRMLTGVWRHRMSDEVWMRLRALQSDVPDPLPNMIPLAKGVEYMSDTLSANDRQKADKGRYFRDPDGNWQKP